MAKMGRPVSENPKDTEVRFRLTKEENDKFENYCKLNNTTKSSVLRKFILGLIGK